MQNTQQKNLEIQLVVFDWDGTLMDSEAQIVSCMHAAIADLELVPRTDEQVRNIIGLGLWEAVDLLYPSMDEDFHRGFTDRYRVHWFGSRGSSRLFPGAKETVIRLRSMGYLLAVATGKGRTGLDKVLKETDMEHLFHATRCSDESGSKPHPAMLEDIMGELAVHARNTIMVGDTEYDLEMATNADTHSIGVSHGVHSIERLRLHHPLAVLDNISEVGSWLEKSCQSKQGNCTEPDQVSG